MGFVETARPRWRPMLSSEPWTPFSTKPILISILFSAIGTKRSTASTPSRIPLTGFPAKISAGILAIFCLTTAFIFHFDFSDQTQLVSFLKNIGLAGGFLFIVANGTKDWAVDKEKKYVRL